MQPDGLSDEIPCGSFRKLEVPYFGVLIIRSYYLGYHIRVPYFRKLPCGALGFSVEFRIERFMLWGFGFRIWSSTFSVPKHRLGTNAEPYSVKLTLHLESHPFLGQRSSQDFRSVQEGVVGSTPLRGLWLRPCSRGCNFELRSFGVLKDHGT